MRLLKALFLCALVHVAFVAQGQSPLYAMVNSAYDEQSPVLSADGSLLFFTVANHPDNVGGQRDPGDIWFSRYDGSSWSAPRHAGPSINNRAYNAVAGISLKGDQLYLHGHYAPNGEMPRSQGIAVASISGNGWSRPANIAIPYYHNKSGLLSGSISDDGSVFVFAAETYGTYGVEDIYVTINENGKWTAPKNLGTAINTQFQELCPSLSADKATLYFSSNGRKGSGSFDVYKAQRLDDSWTNWSEPENLGPSINTEGRELFYRPIDGTGRALYTSTLNSDGYGDVQLYRPDVELPIATAGDSAVSVSSPAFTASQTVPVEEPQATPTAVVRLHGKVFNAKTGMPVAATLSLKSRTGSTQAIQTNGEGYGIELFEHGDYTISIEAAGHISALEKVNTTGLPMKDVEMNFTLEPVAVGTKVNLKSVLFAQAKTEILPESFEELDLVVNFLKANPSVKIELAGHTDNRGVHADNVKLSQMRVDKVKEYLVSKGIEGRRISGKGYGGTRPIASNETEESRRMNRRVEFVVKRF